MDWFDNIGCATLEKEAVSYFQQYLGSFSSQSESDEENSSGDENEYSDIDSECDKIQAKAREFYSNPVSTSTSCTTSISEKSDDPFQVRIDALFSGNCGCSKNCFAKLASYKEQAYNVSLSLHEFTKAERDIYLLSKLEHLEITNDIYRGGKRERKRFKYSFQGVEICECTWRNLYEIGRSEFKGLKKHLSENGVTPRSHGLSGKKSNHSHSFEVIENAVNFIKHYGDEFGLPLPAAPRSSDNTPPILLPCSENKQFVHSKYVQSCVESGKKYVKLTVFKEVWNNCLPHIQFMKPKTDLCKTCFQLREEISGAISEDSKLEKTEKLVDHIQSARSERNFYKKCTEQAREELKLVDSPLGKYNAPCSTNFEKVHYSFDFSQHVTLPHSSQQVGALFFLTPRKVQIFGVCDENYPMQTNYLIDENQTIGENGTRTHGPNAVLSMVHHYLHANSYGETECHFHADNSVGQNKNKTTLHYLLWRCAKGLHKAVHLHFMIAGHTKCVCDACFGMLKKRFRKSDVNTITQLVDVVNLSAKCNRADIYDNTNDENANRLKWFRWDLFFTKYFKPLKGIGKFHHFRFTHNEPGVVYAKKSLDQPEEKIVLIKDHVDVQKLILEQPVVIEPAGFTRDRQKYLYNEIRPFVQISFREEFCPPIQEE